jgi:hypothetical protein
VVARPNSPLALTDAMTRLSVTSRTPLPPESR